MNRNEQGFALATAILALVVVGALVTAGFFAASQEDRVGTSNAQADLAFYIAEQGLQNTLGVVKKRQVRHFVAGDTLVRNGSVVAGGDTIGTYRAVVRAFGGEMFFVESVGTVTRGGRYAGASRRVGTVARTMEIRFPMTAALTTFGGISLRGNALISGIDTNPNVWQDSMCDETALRESGIRTSVGATVQRDGSVEIYGDPAIEPDPTLDIGEFEDFGDIDLAELRSMATHLLSGGSFAPVPTFTGTACNTSDRNNWGDPTPPDNDCSSYFPVIYSRGSLTLGGGGIGQGVLVVEGDMTVNGNFEFYGIVIVTGVFNNNRGSGNAEIHGTLLTKNNADIEDNSDMRGTPVIQFSTCSVDRAIQENDALSRLFPVQKRSWVDLTGAGVEL
ncbi:MAG TPA: pilus assembly PilX N-terminal domain-containing protein [Longimicrobiales bacterium]